MTTFTAQQISESFDQRLAKYTERREWIKAKLAYTPQVTVIDWTKDPKIVLAQLAAQSEEKKKAATFRPDYDSAIHSTLLLITDLLKYKKETEAVINELPESEKNIPVVHQSSPESKIDNSNLGPPTRNKNFITLQAKVVSLGTMIEELQASVPKLVVCQQELKRASQKGGIEDFLQNTFGICCP